MEYKKNRQNVIIESLGKFGTPDWSKLAAPALLSETQAAEIIKKNQDSILIANLNKDFQYEDSQERDSA